MQYRVCIEWGNQTETYGFDTAAQLRALLFGIMKPDDTTERTVIDDYLKLHMGTIREEIATFRASDPRQPVVVIKLDQGWSGGSVVALDEFRAAVLEGRASDSPQGIIRDQLDSTASMTASCPGLTAAVIVVRQSPEVQVAVSLITDEAHESHVHGSELAAIESGAKEAARWGRPKHVNVGG
jgi:hypothetical protein